MAERKDAVPQPVGHMTLVPLSNLMKYALRQEGFKSPEHKHLLNLLKHHNDKAYCEALMTAGVIDSCERANKEKTTAHKTRTAGQPV
jgi:hypothetical protein